MKKYETILNLKYFLFLSVFTRNKKIPRLVLLLLLIGRLSYSQTQVTLNSVADNDIYEGLGFPNYGSCESIYTDGGSGVRDRSLILFNFSSIPINATIISATLTLKKTYGTGTDIEVRRVTNAWTEGTASCSGSSTASNWNERMSGINWTTAGGDFSSTVYATTSVGSNNIAYDWNVTNLVQEWVSGSFNNYGLMLKHVDESTAHNNIFASREYGTPSSRPKLVITYTTSAVFYSKGSFAVNIPSNWNTARDGSGTNAASFGTGNSWLIQNGHNMTLSGSSTWDLSSTGTVRIENGGSWLNSSNGTVTMGAFEVENGGTYSLSGSAIIPGTTISLGAASTVDYSGGDQTISTINYGNLTLSGNGIKTFLSGVTGVAGTLTRDGAFYNTTNNSSTIEFNGAGAQMVPAFGYYHLILSNSGTKTFAPGTTFIRGNLIIGGSASGDGTTNSSLIYFDGAGVQSVGAMNYYNLTFSNTGAKTFSPGTSSIAGTFTIDGSASGDGTTNNTTIEYNGSESQTIIAMDYYNLVLSGSGIKTFAAGTTSISGSFSVTAPPPGSAFNSNSISSSLNNKAASLFSDIIINTTANNSNIRYNGAADQNVLAIDYYDITLSNSGIKYFGPGTVGIGKNLTINDSAAVDAVTYNDTVKYFGDIVDVRYGFINKNIKINGQSSVTARANINVINSLIIDSGGALDMNNYVLTVDGMLVNDGSCISTNPSGSMTFYSKNSGDFNSLNSWSNTGYNDSTTTRLPGAVNNDVLIIGNGKSINLSSNLNNLGTVRVDSSGTLNPGSYILSGPGEFDLRKNGILKITSADGLNKVSGNIQTEIQLFNPFAVYEFSSNVPQVTGMDFLSSVSNIVINNPKSVSLSNNTKLVGELSLPQGNLILGDKNLTLGTEASIAGTPSSSNMIIADGSGQLKKEFLGIGSFTFPVGDSTGTVEYSPITLNFTTGNFSNAYAAVNVVNSKHPQNSSAANFINRYWTVNSSGISDFSCDVTCVYTDADIQPGANEANIFAGKYNGTIWTLLNQADALLNELSGTVSAFSDFTGGESAALTDIDNTNDFTPKSFTLSQNYPNPFNPSTKIKYTIPSVTSLVTLKIYDILGNEVTTLVNERLPAGIYEAVFDASKLSSGVYIYKISADAFSETKKMILSK